MMYEKNTKITYANYISSVEYTFLLLLGAGADVDNWNKLPKKSVSTDRWCFEKMRGLTRVTGQKDGTIGFNFSDKESRIFQNCILVGSILCNWTCMKVPLMKCIASAYINHATKLQRSSEYFESTSHNCSR